MFQKEDFQEIIPEAPIIFSLSEILEIDFLDSIKKHFEFRPDIVIDRFKLKRPNYAKIAVYGHFGRDDPDFI